MTINAKIISHSHHPSGDAPDLITMQVRYPRMVHCFHEDTEFLSQVGDEFPTWRGFEAVQALGAKIAQYDNGEISFVLPVGSVRRPSGGSLVVHKRKTFELAVTPEHRMFSLRRTTGNEFLPYTDTAKEWLGSYTAHRRILQAAQLEVGARANKISPAEAELIAFYVADGHRPKAGTMCQFHFRKMRKVERVLYLLETLAIDHDHRTYADEHVIVFDPPSWVDDCYTHEGEKRYPDCLWNVAHASYMAYRSGTLLSDGNLVSHTINNYSRTVAEQNQIMAALNGEAMNIRCYAGGLYKQTYQDKPYVSFRSDKDVLTEEAYFGDVVCFSVPSSYLFVRYRGFAFVSGNCELMTHRVFSRNASSSRAIPIERMLQDVIDDPAMPVAWGSNKPGMQAGDEVANVQGAETHWLAARDEAVERARSMMALGLHKQVVNRLLEPFGHISVVITATEWDNFFALRCHLDADPTVRTLAEAMRDAISWSEPMERRWHLPYLSQQEAMCYACDEDFSTAALISAARCARVSYLNHDGSNPDIEKDLALAKRLLESKHLSPFEHQAQVGDTVVSNLKGWTQFRKIVE